MYPPLHRPSAVPRSYPSLTSSLYDRSKPGGPSPDAVLALARAPLRWWQRFAGVGLDPLGRLARLMYLHRCALEAERDGQATRADAFWEQLERWTARLAGDRACWEALAARAGARTPDEARATLVGEVLVDSLIAFHNGRLGTEPPPPDDRALALAARAERLLARSGASPAECRAVGLALARERVDGFARAGRWAAAAAAAETALKAAPDDRSFQDLWVECVCSGALAAIGDGKTQEGCAADTARLSTALAGLETFRRAHRANTRVIGALAELWLIQALRQDGAGALSEALVSVERALAFDPAVPDGAALREELAAAMVALRERAGELRAELQRRPGAHLTQAGRRTEQDAARGFGPLTTFRASGELRRIEAAARHPWALRLWTEAGFPAELAEADGRADALLRAVEEVVRDAPADATQLMGAWARVRARDAVVAGLDAGPVLTLLHGRLFADGADAGPEPVGAKDAPVLASRRGVASGRAPLGFWVFSARDLRVKAQIAAAGVLLCVWVTTATSQGLHRDRRDAAYARLAAATQAGDDWSLMAAAEVFLANPVPGDSAREEHVRDAYALSVVREVLATAPGDERLRPHLDRYRAFAHRQPETGP